MQKHNLGIKSVPILACFFFIALCVMTVPKIGITANDTGSVNATATAGKTGENTYKAEAAVTVTSAAKQDIGVYEMTVQVTGKKPKKARRYGWLGQLLGASTTVEFSSSDGCAFTDSIDDNKTYRVRGSTSNFKISASSSGNINGIETSASGSCSASYPQP